MCYDQFVGRNASYALSVANVFIIQMIRTKTKYAASVFFCIYVYIIYDLKYYYFSELSKTLNLHNFFIGTHYIYLI